MSPSPSKSPSLHSPSPSDLRLLELRLLRCSLPQSDATLPPPLKLEVSDHGHLHELINDTLNSIELGHYTQALSSHAIAVVFQLADDSDKSFDDSAEQFYARLENRIDSFLSGEDDVSLKAFLLVAVAVAAFFAFTQSNLTGPVDGILPSVHLPSIANISCGVEWEAWARNQLMSAGSHLLGKFSNLQYIVFAKMLLTRTKDILFQGSVSLMDSTRSISWWLFRVILCQQRIMDERSSSLFDQLQVLKAEILHFFGTLEKVNNYWGDNLYEEASTIVTMVQLEAGTMEYAYGRINSSRIHFESAEEASGLQLSVTGVLGFRTVHQVEPKAQLVLVAHTSPSSGISSELQRNGSSNSVGQHHRETHETSDILMTPRLLDNANSSEINSYGSPSFCTASVPLRAIQQAVILARCLLIEKSTRGDEMQRWDMAPYIEAIDSQKSSYFMIQSFCDILRIRWESSRSRTKERALMMMDKLVQGLYEPSPVVAHRIQFCHVVYIPPIPALRKEYGELLVSCGLIGEAIKTFEDLELWDSLIYCYQLLDKKAAAVELINTRLSETPTDPRLWCSLGDITSNDTCYEKALDVSDNRSARAKRSLARSAYNRGDYEKSKILWESAMALNSLYPDGWFALGAAALKARDVEKALDSFTRAVQLDPDNGEAWNNIACLHMINKKSKESFIAFKEALKFKRNSWQLWENFSQVSADVGNFGQALEAIRMVLDMSSNKRIDGVLLERIMVELEGRISTNHSEETHLDSGLAVYGETEHLVDMLGKILQQIVRGGGGGGADIWGLYARWHRMKGDRTMCSEALLKQVRSYQGSDLWKDKERFKKFANASLELCKVYMEISSSTGSRKELLTAEMHLKNTVKQAGIFLDTEEFRSLQACLGEVKLRLRVN